MTRLTDYKIVAGLLALIVLILWSNIIYNYLKNRNDSKQNIISTPKDSPVKYMGLYPGMSVSNYKAVTRIISTATNGQYGSICKEKYNHYSMQRYASNTNLVWATVFSNTVTKLYITTDNSNASIFLNLLLSDNMAIHSAEEPFGIFVVEKFGSDKYARIQAIKNSNRIEWWNDKYHDKYEQAESKFEADRILGKIK
jgi:hypothetical protein